MAVGPIATTTGSAKLSHSGPAKLSHCARIPT